MSEKRCQLVNNDLQWFGKPIASHLVCWQGTCPMGYVSILLVYC
ncbi:MAG: hypothetical protein EDM05_040070 [Leptolyngbya sp. IPPAS B-1204]